MIAAQELGVKLESIRVMPTSTDKVPNTSATAASAGTDLNGAPVQNPCEGVRTRLIPIAQKLYQEKFDQDVHPDVVLFKNGNVLNPETSDVHLTFAEVVK